LHAYIFGDDSELINYKETNKDELMEEDSDVDQERQDVYNIPRSTYSEYPLIAKNIRKVYPGVNGRAPKVANKNICFKVKSGELFGLLGPNGAGKTTLVTQLSGLYPPTDGNAWIGGFDIKS
jgi:ABC-type polysaccharide/polyol phosphate transport system ATPase subunit